MNLGLSRWRTTALLALAILLSVVTVRFALRHPLGRHSDFDALLSAGGVWACALSSIWLCVVAAALVLEAWSGRRTFGPKAPAALRTLVTISAGLAVSSAALMVPVHAADPGPAPATRLEGLRLPERSTGAAPNVEATPQGATRPAPVSVRPGDTLWSIAKESLPRHASSDHVAAAVRAWHHANHDVIGPNPDVLLPGQQLTPPKETS